MSKMMMQWVRLLAAVLVAVMAPLSGLQAETRDLGQGVQLQGNFVQGGLVTGTAPKNLQVQFQQRKLLRNSDGLFVLGFNRDDATQQQLVIIQGDGRQQTLPFTISAREYDVQKVNGVPARTVNPDPKDMARIEKETAQVAEAREAAAAQAFFKNGFVWPVKGPVSGVYGSQRIFNGEPRSPHFGVDLAVPAGTPIFAPADGVITLAEKDLFFSGGTIILDHGMGINSGYLHMSKLLVKKGDKVKQGQKIGLVGSSGRATGPHLCWRLNWYQSRLDPQLVTVTPKP